MNKGDIWFSYGRRKRYGFRRSYMRYKHYKKAYLRAGLKR